MDRDVILGFLIQSFFQVALLIIAVQRVNVKRSENDVAQESIAVAALTEKLQEFDRLKHDQAETKAVIQELERKSRDQETLNNSMARTIEDQSRRINVLTVDLTKAQTDLESANNAIRELREDNAKKALTISELQNQRDIAVARYETQDKMLSKIQVNVSSIEVINRES